MRQGARKLRNATPSNRPTSAPALRPMLRRSRDSARAAAGARAAGARRRTALAWRREELAHAAQLHVQVGEADRARHLRVERAEELDASDELHQEVNLQCEYFQAVDHYNLRYS